MVAVSYTAYAPVWYVYAHLPFGQTATGLTAGPSTLIAVAFAPNDNGPRPLPLWQIAMSLYLLINREMSANSLHCVNPRLKVTHYNALAYMYGRLRLVTLYRRHANSMPDKRGDKLFFSHVYFPTSGQAVVSGFVPSPPRYVPSVSITHKISVPAACRSSSGVDNSRSRSFCESIRAQGRFLRIYTSTHSGGLEHNN